MDCVFGEVKSVMINGVSYDELFGVDINLLNRIYIYSGGILRRVRVNTGVFSET